MFVFTHDVVASVSPPLLQLAGFARLELAPGESGTVTLALSAARLQVLGSGSEAGVRTRRRARSWWARGPTVPTCWSARCSCELT